MKSAAHRLVSNMPDLARGARAAGGWEHAAVPRTVAAWREAFRLFRAARESGAIRLRRPVPWEGSATTGR